MSRNIKQTENSGDNRNYKENIMDNEEYTGGLFTREYFYQALLALILLAPIGLVGYAISKMIINPIRESNGKGPAETFWLVYVGLSAFALTACIAFAIYEVYSGTSNVGMIWVAGSSIITAHGIYKALCS
jgi:uncharacterized BrkB/YihY/UPF0761 family membrane protein